VSGLLSAGKARAWGTGMWTAAQHHEALAICRRDGVPTPAAAQMATSLVDSSGPDDPEMRRALDEGPIGLVASYTLAGGTLTGKYLTGRSGRAVDDDRGPAARGKALAPRVVELADRWGVPPAHVAMAYALAHPNLASLLFGSRSVDQLRENIGAWATFAGLDDEQRAAVAALAHEADRKPR
jgi:aryl-alcohol dehydrogenase-like predicted oxidoreductase